MLKIFMVGQINKHLLPIGMLLLISILFFYNQDLIGPVAFLIVGGGFLYAGFYIRSKNHKIQANGFRTKAKIVDFSKERFKDAHGESHIYHFPIVNFTDRDGISTIQKLDSNDNPKRLNQLIGIIYLKKENGEYQIIKDNDWWENNFPVICLVFGILFSGIGITLIISKI
ncbi:MAG: DUF3592 domain-containing protein [Bacteroidota bacterium]|nr:DUF3592 domain-containing protein [Bacteroidota bacterium]